MLRDKGYKGQAIKIVLTDVADKTRPFYTDTTTGVMVFDRESLARADRKSLINYIGHEAGHFSSLDNGIKNDQIIANYTGEQLEKKTENLSFKNPNKETIEDLGNSYNVITGEFGKWIVDNIPMNRREYYKAFMLKGSVTKLAVGAGGGFGFVYNKDPITGEEEFGYVGEVQGLLGVDYNAKKMTNVGKVLLNADWGVDSYEKKDKPIKDFQGITAGLEGKIAAFGVGIGGSVDIMEDGKISGNGGLSDTGFKVMLNFGYRYVHKIDNPSETVKNLIRTFTNDPEKLVGNIEAIRILIAIIKKTEELKKN